MNQAADPDEGTPSFKKAGSLYTFSQLFAQAMCNSMPDVDYQRHNRLSFDDSDDERNPGSNDEEGAKSDDEYFEFPKVRRQASDLSQVS